MSDDLIAFLRARLDEDERIARRAGDSFRQIGETGVIVTTEGGRAEECASANWAGVAEQVVRHSPARVLRDVEAKRRIVEQWATHEALDRETFEAEGEYARSLVSLRSAYWDACRDLASVYADHADYREEWRP